MISVVASFTDAWIETHSLRYLACGEYVASFTDAWIETNSEVNNYHERHKSHLLQMRGLKLASSVVNVKPMRRIFYRCVD